MKAKKSLDRMISVPGYVMDVTRREGYLTINTGYRYDYVLPDGYVCIEMSDPNGDAIYVFCHKDTEVTER